MASVQRRKKDGKEYGPWVARWRDENGIQQSKTLTTSLKKEAQKIANEREAECERRRELGIKGEMTVSDAYARYEHSLRAKNVSYRHIQLTRAKYNRLTGIVWDVKNKDYVNTEPFIRPDQNVSQIRKVQLNDFFGYTTEEGLGSDLRYKTQLIVKHLIEIAEDNDCAIPKKRIKFNKISHDQYVPPTVEGYEWDDLLKHLKGTTAPANAVLLLWLMNTGARISEALNARVEDIDIQSRKVFLRRAKGNPDTWWTITDKFADELSAYLILGANRQTFLFESSRRPGQRRSHCQNWFRSGTEKTGMNSEDNVETRGRVRLHTIRHHVISSWIKGGLPLDRASKVIGHKTAAITARYDGTTGEDFQPQVVAIMNQREAKGKNEVEEMATG